MTITAYLRAPVMACAYASMGNRTRDRKTSELARSIYVDALSATHTAIQDPVRVHQDEVLISILLLSLFEVDYPPNSRVISNTDLVAAHHLGSCRKRIIRCMAAAS